MTAESGDVRSYLLGSALESDPFWRNAHAEALVRSEAHIKTVLLERTRREQHSLLGGSASAAFEVGEYLIALRGLIDDDEVSRDLDSPVGQDAVMLVHSLTTSVDGLGERERINAAANPARWVEALSDLGALRTCVRKSLTDDRMRRCVEHRWKPAFLRALVATLAIYYHRVLTRTGGLDRFETLMESGDSITGDHPGRNQESTLDDAPVKVKT